MENSYTRYLEIQEEEKAQKEITTQNGMTTNETSLNECVDLFFIIGAMRGKSKVKLIAGFSKAFSENSLLASKILFWARDVRGGAGERQIFRDILSHLVKLSPSIVLKNLPLISEYGRWDDLFVLFGTKLEDETIDLIKTALFNGNGLCAKWMPRKGEVANKLRRSFGLTPKEYRKMLVNLTDVVETPMCAKEWEKIDYSKLPSVASSRYQKSFYKNDEKRYDKYVQDLADGKTTVNAGALFPYDVVKSLRFDGNKTVCQKQWEALPNYMEENNDIILPVVDVSGSMDCPAGNNPNITCMDVAISLGLYISERNEGTFKDCFLTFASNPTLQYLKGDLYERLSQLRRADWGMSTNIEATFELILTQAVKHNVTAEKMPTKIIILSDMEFDSATGGYWGESVPDWNPSAFQLIQQQYEKAGYKMPALIFWNINARGGNFPVKHDDNNTALVSGFSPSILKAILASKEITPLSVMLDTIEGTRYQPITV